MIDFGNYVYDYIKEGQKYELNKIKKMLQLLRNPQNKFKSVHITGTNGKGSTATYIEYILHNAGFKVGKFTSPHLVSYNERIRLDLEEISKEDFHNILPEIEKASKIIEEEFGDKPSFFEMVTAISFYYFAQKKVDWAVVEVGLGGRLDATNTLEKSIAVVTNIDKDHCGILGNELKDIAKEKIAITKKDCHIISSEKRPELKKLFRDYAKEMNSEIFINNKEFSTKIVSKAYDNIVFDYSGENKFKSLKLNMPGEHQVENAANAVKVAEIIKIDEKYIKQGLEQAFFPGRLEIISKKPFVMMDGAHNRAGLNTLCVYLENYFENKEIVFLSSILRDKNADLFYRKLSKYSKEIVLTHIDNKRMMDIKKMQRIAKKYFKTVFVFENSEKALEYIYNKNLNSSKNIIITGSLYLIGELKSSSIYKKIKK
ncbi:MAG: bifunctional folylpolyglutamate synthase/dihydrofolate synthase [Candidatus Muirbacterium halophilum]|nr:bifunctional folylpolyglutamate synthase/dihydrofolate synthase [Candidatus Muirbacterium halophilum]MCK9474290.1 bifunctional folylpolyglutamate synthase/dihydrofolate synthase [Candidatus Muirbacterium halophilum]